MRLASRWSFVRISTTEYTDINWAHGVTIRNLSSQLAAILPLSIRLLSGDHLDENPWKGTA